MREMFFARDTFSLHGEGHFDGTFHLFKGGRELKGDFTSAQAGVNDYRFPNLAGSLVWMPDRFEVTARHVALSWADARRSATRWRRSAIAAARATARFDVDYTGRRPRRPHRPARDATASGWPAAPRGATSSSGRSADSRTRAGDGHASTVPPPGGLVTAGPHLPD